MPKGKVVIHIGTAQVFKERVGVPQKGKEEKVITPKPEPTPAPVVEPEN